jgi:hypothetical protein
LLEVQIRCQAGLWARCCAAIAAALRIEELGKVRLTIAKAGVKPHADL